MLRLARDKVGATLFAGTDRIGISDNDQELQQDTSKRLMHHFGVATDTSKVLLGHE
jgi:hypothetical protein